MVYFNVKFTTISTWGRTKSFFVLQPGFLAWGPFLGFFWPEEGRQAFWRPKKYQKRAEGQKILAKAQNNFFVIPNGDKWSVLNVECHFFTYRKSFPFEKVSFVMEKIATGWKDFLFWFARNEKNRAQTKTCPIRKKWLEWFKMIKCLLIFWYKFIWIRVVQND